MYQELDGFRSGFILPLDPWKLGAWEFTQVARPKRYVLIQQWEKVVLEMIPHEKDQAGLRWDTHWVIEPKTPQVNAWLKSKDPKLKRLVVPNSLWPTPHNSRHAILQGSLGKFISSIADLLGSQAVSRLCHTSSACSSSAPPRFPRDPFGLEGSMHSSE